MGNFKLEKENALNKRDKSHEQKWDDKILELCSKINLNENYFTTSSCAGRITIVRSASKKVPNAFVFKTHEKTSAEEIWSALLESAGEKIVYFRQEPCALHVSCRTLNDAIWLLSVAKQAGWKRSGIFSTSRDKFTCELYSTEWVIVPVVKDGEILIEEGYLRVLVNEANSKLERTWEKIGRFEKIIS